MDPIPPARSILYPKDTDYRSSVSQALLFRLGAICNFLSFRHIETKRFIAGGNYGPAVIGALPFLAIDMAEPFEYPVEIVNIHIFNRIKGSSGTTTLDLKWKAAGSSTWESIFTGSGGQQPAINSAASNFEMCGMGQTVAGFTPAAPVKTKFDAGDMLRMDLITSMAGNPNGCALIVNYRPR